MSAPLAQLYALALRTLELQERRAAELRGRLAPVLAAGGLGATLLAAPAAGALVRGGPWCGVALVVTVAALVVTITAAVRLLRADPERGGLDVLDIRERLRARDAMHDETTFCEVMIDIVAIDTGRARSAADALHHQFTVVLGGILFVLCGLALAALLA